MIKKCKIEEQDTMINEETRKPNSIFIDMQEIPYQILEAINVLRGNIQLSGYKLKVIAVTSASIHEGKSTISFQLARSLAILQKTTLYIDCDIRNSMFKTRYNVVEATQGLSEFLAGNVGIHDIIYKIENEPYLDIIFAGAVAPNPSELLSSEIFEQMIKLAKKQYDYLIIDTPPVNAVIDGVLVAKHCDGTVLVVESEVTERAQAIRAQRKLEYAGVKILGAVLNKAGKGQKRYDYGYSYGKKKDKKKNGIPI